MGLNRALRRSFVVGLTAAVASVAGSAFAAPAHAGIWVGYWNGSLCSGQWVRGPANSYDYMSRNQVTTNGGYWDIGFTRANGSYQNTGVIQTTNYTLYHNYPGLAAYAWYQSHNGLCVGTTGRYLSYP